MNHIADFLNQQLLPNYVAYPEQSLQQVDEHIIAVNIREAGNHQQPFGRLVLCIELISPATKSDETTIKLYTAKRYDVLSKGIPFIEINLVHQLSPLSPRTPTYPSGLDSCLYTLTLMNPRPNLEEGVTYCHCIHVGQAIPNLSIPLLDETSISFDFDAVYQHTFRTRRYVLLLDYTQLPVRFETYSAEDQATIRQQMAKL